MKSDLDALVAKRGYRPKILVVDDQPLNIRIIYELFKDEYDVYMAVSGEQATAQCELHLPDLVMLDVIMPDMDGYEVCRRLKENISTRQIPVIFVTAQHHEADEVHGFSLGAVDFISKPVNTLLIRARVKTHLALKLHSDLMGSIALLDGLTGIANRRRFEEELQLDWLQCARVSKTLSILMIDIDHFKDFNDHYGHQSGDDCLRKVAVAIKSIFLRPHDLVARYGGEEFACLLPDTDHNGAQHLASQVVDVVRGLQIEHAKSTTAQVVTVSVGVATQRARHEALVSELVLAADKQLYEAKRSGRGRFCAQELP